MVRSGTVIGAVTTDTAGLAALRGALNLLWFLVLWLLMKANHFPCSLSVWRGSFTALDIWLLISLVKIFLRFYFNDLS